MSTTTFDDLVAFDVSVANRVATVTLLGPGRGNAMGPDFFSGLPKLMAALDADPNVRAIVITGSGTDFSYGLDLAAMSPLFDDLLSNDSVRTRMKFLDDLRRLQRAISSVAECRTPVVASVSGWCIGGGVDLIAAADVRVASADAKFSVREAKVAIVADIGSLQRLSTIIGEGHLRQLALTGEDIDAAKAASIQLVNDVCPTQEGALAAAHEIARQIAANSPLVSRGIKDVLDTASHGRIEAGLRYVGAWNAAFLGSEDLAEALRAFAERRPPVFEGR